MPEGKTYTLILLTVLLLACSHGEKGGQETPEEISADVQVFGGRDRFVFKWSGLPSEAEGVSLASNTGKTYTATLPFESGECSFAGVPEGEVRLKTTWQTSAGPVSGPDLSTFVYGSHYEEGLRPWEMESGSLRSGIFNASMSAVVTGSTVAEEFRYTDTDGIRHEFTLAADAADKSVHFSNVSGEISYRTVHVPEPRSGDRFYTPWAVIGPKAPNIPTPDQVCETVDGYRGIWFALGQVNTEYGDKYSGGLGTYTMKHIPMAVYCPEADRTYFVYGGTPSKDKKYLQCMIGCYDHATGLLQKPRVVMDKGIDGVLDPHDDPTVQIDRDGYIWVFVAGRSTKREGRRYRSVNPYDITAFEYINQSFMAYPQVFYDSKKGFFLFFTRYDGVRQLFWQTSQDGVEWTPYKQLASIKNGSETKSGHYQISNMYGTKICTAFNRHINGNVDTRTNIYFLQSTDWGESWTTVDGKSVQTPVTTLDNDALVRDYQSLGKNCYIKDVNFDEAGNPIILYLISDNHLTGPQGGAREWFTLSWNGSEWIQAKITESTHCYDSGSIWTDGGRWTVLAPTKAGPQYWGAGGEVQRWVCSDHGRSWALDATLTHDSPLNHSYMRRPQKASDGFYAFWADGNPDQFSISHLYFCNREGKVFRMPYDMSTEWAAPETEY
ncbi:MAG: BNR-4 repeat-containing protein [Bacteroidales bacterium]|nr:BNR-4 repeat-containing protein [Bacteroidales bacterium]